MKCSAYGVLEHCHCMVQSLVYYICVQPCITILISYLHNKSYNDLLLFVYLSMLLQRFYSLILPNPVPGVQIAYNKYMSIYSGQPFKITLYAVYTSGSIHWIHKICRLHFQSRENGQCQVFCSVPTTGCVRSAC
jgi:hypothetical protein